MCSWTVSSWNHGRNRWAHNRGGIPASTPKWQLLKCAKYGVNRDVCATEGKIFLSSAQELAVSIDIDTGEKLWEASFPEEAAYGIAINDAEVCVAPYIMSQETGEIVDDLSRIGCAFRAVQDVDGGSFFLSVKGGNDDILIYDKGVDKSIGPNLIGVSSFDNGSYLVGIKEAGILCVSHDNLLWSVSFPVAKNNEHMSPSSGYIIIEGMVYQHFNYDTVRCIDLVSGDVKWQSGPEEIEQNETPYQCKPPNKFLGCKDALYLCREMESDGFLQARSTEDGRELWRVEAPDARAFLIAGDLLFGVLNDFAVAWDRHTGEVVWRAEKPMTATYHAVAAGNKVVYNNTLSQMRCYEWTEPYHSPANPNA